MTEEKIPKIEYWIRLPLALARTKGGNLVDKLGAGAYKFIKIPLDSVGTVSEYFDQRKFYSALEKEAEKISKELGIKIPTEAVYNELFNKGFMDSANAVLGEYNETAEKMKKYFESLFSKGENSKQSPSQNKKKSGKNNSENYKRNPKALIPDQIIP
ncbi:hypothetical protein K9M16_04995 [Candidatus Babeliales bacterium]|nr:hypothetical protein [Candidatus Babeliales bacterium]MCF7910142.1 hypothetical protein [Candidatus Pacearchaeota archaeon]